MGQDNEKTSEKVRAGTIQDQGGITLAHADASRSSEVRHNPPPVPLSEIALTGIYEISKILNAPARLETTLSNVINLLSSFMQMHHGVIALLADDGIPDITVGAGWNESADERYRVRLPE